MASPMLLSVYGESILAKSASWFMSEKYDGWRMMYHKGEFTSRSGLKINVPPEMMKDIEQFGDDNNLIFDGELWNGYGKFTEIQSDLNVSSTNLKFLVFDMPSAPGNFQERLKELSKCFAEVKISTIKLVKHQEVGNTNVETINKFYDNVIQNGGEGIVLKPSNLMYEFGKRSTMFLKRKPWDTMEVPIVGYFTSKEKQNNEGYVSSLVCETAGKPFKVQYKNYNAPDIGTQITIKYSQTTVTGLPKFPQLLNMKPTITTKTTKIIKPEPIEIVQEKNVPSCALTIAEWTARGGFSLQNGEAVQVKSDRTDEVYIVKREKQGESVYCSCCAWKYQKLNPVCRTCKHCIAVLGVKADAIRVAKAVLQKLA